MKSLRKYNNKTEYDADSANIAEVNDNVISLIGNSNIIVDGVNIIVPLMSAERGDIAIFDTIENKRKVVKCLTFDATKLDSRYIVCDAVCIGQRANKMLFLYKNDAGAYRWAQGYQVKLEGFDLVNGGTLNISLTSRTNVENQEITYPTNSTYESIATLINAVTGSYWRAYSYVSGVYLEHNDYTGGVLTINSSTPTITQTDIAPKKYQLTYSDVTKAYNEILRNKGLVTTFAGLNFDKFRDYYSVNGENIKNFGEMSPYIIRESVFNETDNPILYNKYNGSYDNYLKSEMLKKPVGRKVMSDWDDNGKILSEVMFTDVNGVKQPAYHCAYSVNKNLGLDAGAVTTGFEKGNFYLPDADELERILAPILYPQNDGNRDNLNIGILKIGGVQVDVHNKYYWSSSQFGSNYAWGYNSSYGIMYGYFKGNNYYGLGVAAFEN